MLADVPLRETRQFYLYKYGYLALIVEDRPGTLHSQAAPGPDGPPQHPFAHSIGMNASMEDETGRLLRQANSFDEYLDLLLGVGFDVMSADNDLELQREGGLRIEDDRGSAGALWPQSGQFTTLKWQPISGQLTFPQAIVSVYRHELANSFLTLLTESDDFDSLCQALANRGYRLVAIGSATG